MDERVDDIREGMIDYKGKGQQTEGGAKRYWYSFQREQFGFPENRGESEEDIEQIAKITDPEILKKHPNLKDAVITKIHRNKQFKPDQARPRDIIVKATTRGL